MVSEKKNRGLGDVAEWTQLLQPTPTPRLLPEAHDRGNDTENTRIGCPGSAWGRMSGAIWFRVPSIGLGSGSRSTFLE